MKTRNLVTAAFAAAVTIVAGVSSAQALAIQFKLTISQNPVSTYSAAAGDNPLFQLENQSEGGLEITRIDFSIGNPAYNFDRVTLTGTTAGGVYTLGAPAGGTMSIFGSSIDTVNGGVRSDSFSLAFTDFDPGEVARWTAEIDQDSPPAGAANNAANFRTVFFDNGGASVPNSTMTVHFSDLRTLVYSISGVSQGQIAYTFIQGADDFTSPGEVPLPAALPLLGAGLAGLGVAARKRRRA